MRDNETNDESIFDKITPSEALQILKMLAQGDPSIGQRIEEIFLNQVQEVEVSEISDTVFFDLDFLDVEELWDRSGAHRDGYSDTVEAAWEMIEEVMEPHRENMQRLHSLEMFREEMRYCMGVISGLYRYESESTTEFKDWAVDMPRKLADQILTEWTGSCHCPKMLEEMKQFEAASHK
jgi:hypothetical protein